MGSGVVGALVGVGLGALVGLRVGGRVPYTGRRVAIRGCQLYLDGVAKIERGRYGNPGWRRRRSDSQSQIVFSFMTSV